MSKEKSSDTFTQLVSSVTDYNRKIAAARKTLATIHTSFHEGIRPELQRLGQYVQDLQLAQTLSAAASKSKAAMYQTLVDTVKHQVEGSRRVLVEQQVSYQICKIEQDDNIEKWGIEIGKINRQLSILLDF